MGHRRIPGISPARIPVTPDYLPPFAMGPAFPTADYYGGSVALGVSPVRRSRVSCVNDVQDGCRCPVRGLEVGYPNPALWSVQIDAACQHRLHESTGR
jgi:hypothetical protein